jgi:hypothetical protein
LPPSHLLVQKAVQLLIGFLTPAEPLTQAGNPSNKRKMAPWCQFDKIWWFDDLSSERLQPKKSHHASRPHVTAIHIINGEMVF